MVAELAEIYLRAVLERNAYCPGETVFVVFECHNRSSVEVGNVKLKLMRRLTITNGAASNVMVEEICRSQFEGVKAGAQVTGDNARRLAVTLHGAKGKIPPQTSSKLIKESLVGHETDGAVQLLDRC